MLIHRLLTLCSVLICLSSALVFAKDEEEPLLHIYTWGGVISPKVIDLFTAETGIQVALSIFENDEVPEVQLLTGSTGYDLITPSLSPFFLRQVKLGLYESLDKKLIPNWSGINPGLLSLLKKLPSEPLMYGMPFSWGTTGLAYNVSKIQDLLGPDIPRGMNLLFDEDIAQKLSHAGIYMLDSPQDVLTATLFYLQVTTPGNLGDSKNLKAAVDLLRKISPHVRRFTSNTEQAVTSLASGEVALALCWSGEALRAQILAEEMDDGVKIDYILPQTGVNVWIHMMAIPKGAHHPKNAHAFMNFVMRPDIAAINVAYSLEASACARAKSLLPKHLAHNKILYPDESIFRHVYLLEDMTPQDDRRMNRAWYGAKVGI